VLVATGLDPTQTADTALRFQGLPEAARLASLAGGFQMLVALAVRNKDRVGVVWPSLRAALGGVLPAGAPLVKLLTSRGAHVELVRRSLGSSLHLCRRMGDRPGDAMERLLAQALGLLVRTDLPVMWELALFLADELRLVLRRGGRRLQSPQVWRPLAHLLGMCALHAQASAVVLEALGDYARTGSRCCLTLASHGPVVELACRVADAREEHGQPGGAAARALAGVLGDAGRWLAGPGATGEGDEQGAPDTQALRASWRAHVAASVRLAGSSSATLRNGALEDLGAFLQASAALNLGQTAWVAAVSGETGLVPLLERSLSRVNRAAFPEGEETLRLGCAALSRALAAPGVDPSGVWESSLTAFDGCIAAGSADLRVAVGGLVRNLLLVLARRGILRPAWRGPGGADLWLATWHAVAGMGPGMAPEVLLGQPLRPAKEGG